MDLVPKKVTHESTYSYEGVSNSPAPKAVPEAPHGTGHGNKTGNKRKPYRKQEET